MKVLCFARIPDPALFEVLEFYREDLAIIEGMGFEVGSEHLTRAAARSDADVLYAWWGASALPALLLFRARGRKCILTGAIAFRDSAEDSWRWRLRSALIVIASRVANCTLAVSQYELQDLRKWGIRNAGLAYHSVDTDYFFPGPKSPRPSAATVGQLNVSSIERKGIEKAIAATALVRRTIPDFELTVAGLISPDGLEWLEKARDRHDFSGVNIVSSVDRDAKRALLQSSWLYLQPSRYEAFGVAVVEAMACGTPAVHSNGGALPEVAGSGGIAVGGECSPVQLADAIVGALSSPADLDALAQKARARALSFGRVARQASLDSAFRSVLGDRHPAATAGRGDAVLGL